MFKEASVFNQNIEHWDVSKISDSNFNTYGDLANTHYSDEFKNSDKLYDEYGNFAKKGKTDKFIFDQYLDNYYYSKINSKRSLDTNDFDVSFAKGLSLENGVATITKSTISEPGLTNEREARLRKAKDGTSENN